MTRVCTLVSVILNMLAFDTSSPINCQVCILSLGSSKPRPDRKRLGKALGYLSSRKQSLSEE